MRQIELPEDLRTLLDEARRSGKQIGFVPTMGALHEGHLSLCRASVRANDLTVVSIFVNPLQFGPGEDFDRYPRNLEADQALLSGVGVDYIFVPDREVFYPAGFDTYVEVQSISKPFEGSVRTGHFRGVATVVLKLLNCMGPCAAYFGQKDYQQLQLVRRMVQDLNVPTKIVMAPTVREADGLALSSRNRYLSPDERLAAPAIYAALSNATDATYKGMTNAASLTEAALEQLAREPLLSPEYVALVDAETMQPIRELHRPAVMLIAVRLGTTRLIDNMILIPPP